MRVSFERQNVEPGMSHPEVETFEIRYSWFDILPFNWVALPQLFKNGFAFVGAPPRGAMSGVHDFSVPADLRAVILRKYQSRPWIWSSALRNGAE